MKLSTTLAATMALCAQGTATTGAQAALQARPGGMVYDTTLNITWLADWNYAKTSGFNAVGAMNWTTANSWANNLVYGGFSDWRLPTSLNTNGTGPCGPATNCSGSEMGHMFYNNWGATADNAFSNGTNAANLALFNNVQSFYYWSGTERPVESGFAWYFFTFQGYQGSDFKPNQMYAVAVRPGDVIAAIPEPQTYAMMLAGLGVLAFMWRRRAA